MCGVSLSGSQLCRDRRSFVRCLSLSLGGPPFALGSGKTYPRLPFCVKYRSFKIGVFTEADRANAAKKGSQGEKQGFTQGFAPAPVGETRAGSHGPPTLLRLKRLHARSTDPTRPQSTSKCRYHSYP